MKRVPDVFYVNGIEYYSLKADGLNYSDVPLIEEALQVLIAEQKRYDARDADE